MAIVANMLGAMYYMKGEKAKGDMIMDVMRWIEEGYSKDLKELE